MPARAEATANPPVCFIMSRRDGPLGVGLVTTKLLIESKGVKQVGRISFSHPRRKSIKELPLERRIDAIAVPLIVNLAGNNRGLDVGAVIERRAVVDQQV